MCRQLGTEWFIRVTVKAERRRESVTRRQLYLFAVNRCLCTDPTVCTTTSYSLYFLFDFSESAHTFRIFQNSGYFLVTPWLVTVHRRRRGAGAGFVAASTKVLELNLLRLRLTLSYTSPRIPRTFLRVRTAHHHRLDFISSHLMHRVHGVMYLHCSPFS